MVPVQRRRNRGKPPQSGNRTLERIAPHDDDLQQPQDGQCNDGERDRGTPRLVLGSDQTRRDDADDDDRDDHKRGECRNQNDHLFHRHPPFQSRRQDSEADNT